jgi:hypothetical protein
MKRLRVGAHVAHEPGDVRGTVVGKKGRFWGLWTTKGHPDYATRSIEDGFDWSSLSWCFFERQSSVPCGGRISTSSTSTTTAPTRRRLFRAAFYVTSKATRTSGASACRSASGRRASRPDGPQMPPRTAQPPALARRCTSHTRSNVTGYRRSERSSSSSASRIEGHDRGGKRHAPPV